MTTEIITTFKDLHGIMVTRHRDGLVGKREIIEFSLEQMASLVLNLREFILSPDPEDQRQIEQQQDPQGWSRNITGDRSNPATQTFPNSQVHCSRACSYSTMQKTGATYPRALART